MPERVLAENLSGEEVRLAILDRIGQALRKDCYLSPDKSYEFFECHVKLSLKCHDVGRIAEVEATADVIHGENPDALLEAAEAEFDMTPQPPNEVRVASGQDVPVLSKNAEGKPEIRKVRYARKAKV